MVNYGCFFGRTILTPISSNQALKAAENIGKTLSHLRAQAVDPH